jgi:hypothetical protein
MAPPDQEGEIWSTGAIKTQIKSQDYGRMRRGRGCKKGEIWSTGVGWPSSALEVTSSR